MSEIVQLEIPLNFVGTPAGVKEGGMLDVSMHEIEIKCKASDIPHQLDINVEEMVVGDSIHIEDLDFGDLEIVSSFDLLVATVSIPKVYEEPEEEELEDEEGVEGEEGEEGAEDTEGTQEETSKEE